MNKFAKKFTAAAFAAVMATQAMAINAFAFNLQWYSMVTHCYYTTVDAAIAASFGNRSLVKVMNGAKGQWYNSYTQMYFMTEEDAKKGDPNGKGTISQVESSTLSDSLVSNTTTGWHDNKFYSGFYFNGKWYPTLNEAYAAGGKKLGDDITYAYTEYYYYYNDYYYNGHYNDYYYGYYYDGKWYDSLADAIAAGGHAVGVDIYYIPYSYYHNYYYPYAPGHQYIFRDPYYYWSVVDPGKPTTPSKPAETTAEDGVPYFYGSPKKHGWKTIASTIAKGKTNLSYKIDMNGAVVVDSSVLEAIQGRNISVTFILDNGVKWTIHGKNVKAIKDINIYTEYNIDYIPRKLVKKATKNAISSAQVGISNTFSKLAASSSVTVKFGTERAGCTAKIYLYDRDNNVLRGVSKAKVQSNGNCTFTVKYGGPYLIVLE